MYDVPEKVKYKVRVRGSQEGVMMCEKSCKRNGKRMYSKTRDRFGKGGGEAESDMS
jgi:hypothetical protein